MHPIDEESLNDLVLTVKTAVSQNIPKSALKILSSHWCYGDYYTALARSNDVQTVTHQTSYTNQV